MSSNFPADKRRAPVLQAPFCHWPIEWLFVGVRRSGCLFDRGLRGCEACGKETER